MLQEPPGASLWRGRGSGGLPCDPPASVPRAGAPLSLPRLGHSAQEVQQRHRGPRSPVTLSFWASTSRPAPDQLPKNMGPSARDRTAGQPGGAGAAGSGVAPTLPTGLPAHAQTPSPGQHPRPSPRLSAPTASVCPHAHHRERRADLNRDVLKMPEQLGGGRRLCMFAFPTGVFHLRAGSAGQGN